MTEHADHLDSVRTTDVQPGDWVLVTTKNSLYSIYVLENGRFSVSGGWFDLQGMSPATVTINGCTWGGSAIKCDVVAARGLFLEFGNRLTTTRIQHIKVIRGSSPERFN